MLTANQEGATLLNYACIASNAKDFARLAKLYKNHGKWNGEVLLDSAFIAKSIKPRFQESPCSKIPSISTN